MNKDHLEVLRRQMDEKKANNIEGRMNMQEYLMNKDTVKNIASQ